MIKPEEDFDSWSSILVGSLEPGGEYMKLLPDCGKLIDNFLQCEYSFPSPIENKLDTFLSSVLPQVINSLVQFSSYPQNELDLIANFFQKVVSMTQFAMEYDYFVLLEAIIIILDKNSGIGSRFPKKWEVLAKQFIDYQFLTISALRILETGIPPKLNHYCFIFTIMSFLNTELPASESNNIAKMIFPSTFELFTRIDPKDRNIDNKYLSRLCQGIIETGQKDFESSQDMFTVILSFAFECLKVDILERQIFGINLLTQFANSQTQTIKQLFMQFAADSNLVDYFLSKDLHRDIISNLAPIFKALVLTQDHLLKLWSTTIKSHVSQRNVFYPLIASLLPSFDKKIILSFLDLIFNQETLKAEHFPFISNIISNLSGELQIETINKVVFISRNNPDLFTVAFETLKSLRTNTQVRIHLIKICKEGALKHFDQLTKQLFPFLIESTTSQQTDFPKSFIENLIKTTVKSNYKKDLLKILSQILIKTKTPLNKELIDPLMACQEKDLIWIFLTELLQKLGTNAFDKSTFVSIGRIIENQELTNQFLSFLRVFILVNALFDNSISGTSKRGKTAGTRLIPSKICLNSIPLPYDSVLFEALKNENVSSKAESIITEIYSNSQTTCNEKCMLVLLNYFKEFQTPKFLSIILKIIKNIEASVSLEEYGLLRHERSPQQKKILIEEIDLKLRIDGFDTTIKINKHGTIYDLKELIAKMKNKPTRNIKISYKNNPFSNKKVISTICLKQGDFLLVNIGKSGTSIPLYPTIYLNRINFVGDLLKNLQLSNDEDNDKVIWEFLMYLPTPKELITKWENVKDCIEELNQAKPYILKYNLQNYLLSSHSDVQKASFCENKGIEMLELKLSDSYFSMICSPEIIQMLSDHFRPSFIERAHILIPLLLSQFEYKNQNSIKYAIQIFSKMCDVDPNRISQIITANKQIPKMIKDNLQYIPQELWNEFYRFITTIKSAKLLLAICSSKDLENSPYNIDIYADYIKKDTKINVDKIIPQVFSIISSSSQIALIVDTLHDILPKKCDQNSLDKYIYKFLNLSQKCQNRDKLFKLATLSKKATNVFLNEMCAQKTDRWSYDITQTIKSILGEVGLRNYGATCYMNSIFQQLYHTFPFAYMVKTYEFKEESHQKLQHLFQRMGLTVSKFCEPEPFINTWVGWNQQSVNPKEQQDAIEFLQYLLDQLPDELSGIFRGCFVNIIEDLEDRFSYEKEEPFYSLCLTVKGFSDFQTSLEAFSQEELFTGNNQYYSEDLDDKVDARKYIRIRTAPPVLVVQLKRFEFNANNWARYKVHDFFEFPPEINLRDIMFKDEGDVVYELSGIVIHTGEVNAGHYYSIIKKNDKWYRFNDIEVSEVENYELEAFGSESRKSAVLLFYQKEGFSMKYRDNELKFEHPIGNAPHFDEAAYKEIKKDNENILTQQCVFSSELLDLMLQEADSMILFKYFINVYCHSRLVSQAEKFTKRLIALIDKENSSEEIIEYITSNFSDIYSVYVNCSQEVIVRALTAVLIHMMKSDSFTLVILLLVQSFKETPLPYRQIPEVGNLILPYSKFNNKIALIEELCSYINESYKSPSSVFLKNCNFSSIFEAISILAINTQDREAMKPLISLSQQILQSPFNAKSYYQMLAKCAGMNIFEFDKMIAILSQSKDISKERLLDILIDVIEGCETKESIEETITRIYQQQFNEKQIVDKINERLRSGEVVMRNRILQFPDKLIIDFLTNEDADTRGNTEHMILYTFPSIRPFSNHPIEKLMFKCQSVDPPQEFKMNCEKEMKLLLDTFLHSLQYLKVENFIRMLHWLVERTHVDIRNQIIPEIKKATPEPFRLNESFCELLQIIITEKILIDVFNKVFNESNLADIKAFKEDFHVFLPLFMSLDDKMMKLILKQKQWKLMSKNLASLSSYYDLDDLDKFMNCVIPLLPATKDICLQIIFDGDMKHISVTAKYLNPLFSFFNQEHIDKIYRTLVHQVNTALKGNKEAIEKSLNVVNELCQCLVQADLSGFILDLGLATYFNKSKGSKPVGEFIAKCCSENASNYQEIQTKTTNSMKLQYKNTNVQTNWYSALLRCMINSHDGEEMAKTVMEAIYQHEKRQNGKNPKILFAYFLSARDEGPQWNILMMKTYPSTQALTRDMKNSDEKKFYQTVVLLLTQEQLIQLGREIVANLRLPQDSSSRCGNKFREQVKKLIFIMKRRSEILSQYRALITFKAEDVISWTKSKPLDRYYKILFDK